MDKRRGQVGVGVDSPPVQYKVVGLWVKGSITGLNKNQFLM